MKIARALALLLMAGCPDERKAEESRRAKTVAQLIAEGRSELAKNRADMAVQLFKEAANLAPREVEPHLQLAEAYRLNGNQTAAILTLKRAEELAGGNDPSIKRARADVYLRMRQVKPALVEFLALRDLGILTDGELHTVALLLAREGRIAEAYSTIDLILRRVPDDPPTKVVEAEVMLLEGKELEAAKLMDTLLGEHPELTKARVLRARYFIANELREAAEADLSSVSGSEAASLEVLALRARLLFQLRRFDDAAKLLEPLVEKEPKNAQFLALLAEARLLQQQGAEAEALVHRALAEDASCAQALYVRGLSLEEGGNSTGAIADYEAAVRSDPFFAAPHTRLWSLYEARQDTGPALAALERVIQLGEGTWKEKLALARLYVATGTNVTRARALVGDVLRRDPQQPEALNLKARIDRPVGPKRSGVTIVKPH